MKDIRREVARRTGVTLKEPARPAVVAAETGTQVGN